MILQNTSFRVPVQFMTEALLFIKSCSLKKRGSEEHGLLRYPPQGWFRNTLCHVIDIDKDATWMVLLDNAGVILLINHYIQSMPCL